MTTDVELRLTADLAQATKNVGGFRKEYAELVKAVEKPLRQVTAFRELETSLEGIERQSRSARDRVRDLGNELARSANPSKELNASYRDAVNELRRLERAEGAAQTRLAGYRRELQSAGVDTRNLASEQQRLQAVLAKASLDGRRAEAVQGIRAQSAALAQVVREQRAVNLEEARAGLGVNRYRQLETDLVRVRTQYQLLRTSGNLTNRELSVAQLAYTRRVQETRAAMSALVAEQQRVRGGGAMLPGLVSGVGAAYATAAAIKGIANQADAYNLMNARLRLATASQEEFTTAQRELARIAQATESPVAALVTLYGRISRPLREAGRSQADILKVTEAVATSFRVSGATAQEAENGVIQFAQALGAGALRGEEFNSVAEQAPRLMQALAAGIGVPVGALKEMAAQGQLTAQVVTDALTGQLETLRREAETLPDTVGGAMTQLKNVLTELVGGTDVQPLIDQITRLSQTLSDPQLQEGLQVFTGLLVKLGAVATGLVGDVARLAPDFAALAAAVTGNLSELDRLDAKIRMVRDSLETPGPTDAVFNFLAGLSEEDLQAELDMLTQARAKLIEQQTGLNEEMQFLAEVAEAAAETARERDLANYTKYIGDLKALQDKQVKDSKAAVKNLLQEEKRAVTELEKVRQQRLSIDKRYQEALSGLGGTGTASYGSAQALKVGARQALQDGDIEGAQAQAQAALKMLQDLAAAGENTYGFEGFIRELQAIELAANDIEATNAEAKIQAIKDQIASIEEGAKVLENLPLSIKADEASINAVRTQIQQLAAQISSTPIVIPVTIANPDGPIIRDIAPLSQDYILRDIPALAGGGKLTGPGTGTSDSILMWGSNGEFMQPEASVKYYGQDFMEAIRRRALPRYATGGLIGERAMPSIPALAPALQQRLDGGGDRDFLGDITLQLPGGESLTMAVPRGQGDNLKLLRMKFGGTHK